MSLDIFRLQYTLMFLYGRVGTRESSWEQCSRSTWVDLQNKNNFEGNRPTSVRSNVGLREVYWFCQSEVIAFERDKAFIIVLAYRESF